MIPDFATLKQSIAIRNDYVAKQQTSFRVLQHGKGLSSGKFTVFQPEGTYVSEKSACAEKQPEQSPQNGTLMYVDGQFGTLDAKRSFRDNSGLPLFDLYHKAAGVTWYVELPGGNDTAIARLAPRFSALKDKLEVCVKNAAANGEDTILHVQGQDIWKQRTNVYLGDKVVMTVKRTDKWSVYLPGKNLEWMVDVVAGMDISLATVIVVVLAANMYDSSMQHSSSS